MATVFERLIDPGGTGHYTTLSAWEAARQGDIVTRDTIELATCYRSAAAPDTAQCTLAGWTTDSDHYIWIRGRHVTQPEGQGTPVYLMNAAPAITTGAIRTTNFSGANHIAIDRLQVGFRAVTGRGINLGDIGSGAGWLKISRTRVTGPGNLGNGCYGIVVAGANKVSSIHNCVVDGVFGTGLGINPPRGIYVLSSGSNVYIYNCTVVVPFATSVLTEGINGESNVRVKNCLVRDCNTAFQTIGGFHPASNFNVCDVGFVPGPDSKLGYATFERDITGGPGGLHLHPSDAAARRQGLDLSDDLFLPFNDDMEGTPRLQVWDVGADQITAEDHLWPDRVRMLRETGDWFNWVGSGSAPGSAGGGSPIGEGSGGEGGGENPF